MSSEYNSRLISDLYKEKDEESATKISEEMVEIGDDIFVNPIFDAYTRFSSTSMSHYFVFDLASFKSSFAIENLKKIAKISSQERDLAMMMRVFIDTEYFDEELVEKVKSLLIEKLVGEDIDSSDNDFFEFIYKAKVLPDLIEFMRDVFESESSTRETKKIILTFLLKENPNKNFQYFLDNYNKIKNTKAEIVFAEETAGWSKGIIPQVKDKILKEGSTRAKEIIQKSIDKDLKRNEKLNTETKKTIENQYPTADLISAIGILRAKINTLTTTSKKFGFPLLPQYEELYVQNEPAQSKQSLFGYCMVLRTCIQEYNINEEYSLEEMRIIIPDVENTKGSINRLNVALVKRDINVDKKLFGLRDLNELVNRFAHPDPDESLLIETLDKHGLLGLYKENRWDLLHRKILEQYKDYLELLYSALSNDTQSK